MHLWRLILALFAAAKSFCTGFLVGKRFGTAACTKVWSKRVTQIAEGARELRAETEEFQREHSCT